jgi:C_GCAxxG_C_C family probable redox protein
MSIEAAERAERLESAIAAFREGLSCSQAVLSTYGPHLGLERELALRIAAPFGGGIARTGGICGAVSGALMALGLKHGPREPKDEQARERVYALAQEFIDEFTARNGSILCHELLGRDLSSPKGRRWARVSRCPKFVRDGAEILERLLELA